MIKAVNQWCFPGGTDIAECIRQAASFGFQGFEPAFDAEGPLSPAFTEDSVRRVRDAASDNGMVLTSLATGLYWRTSPSSTDKAVRAKALDIIKRQLECAALLGVNAILVVPGLVDKDTPYDDAYRHAQDTIGAALDTAKAVQVAVGVENVWNKFLLSPLETRDFIDAFKSEWVKMYFDAGNVLQTGFPDQWIRILGKRIVKVHIKDFSLAVNNINGFVDLLSGDVDFPAVMAALSGVGYDDAIIAELAPARHYPEAAIQRASYAMDRILGA